MTKPPSDTRQRIQDVARTLFTQKGVQRTSLQDIADLLGITKPALYYHFDSREDLVRSILQPLIDEGEAFVAGQERRRKHRVPHRGNCSRVTSTFTTSTAPTWCSWSLNSRRSPTSA